MAGNLSKERSYLITPLIFVSLIHVTDLPEVAKHFTHANQDQDHDERAPSARHTCLLPPRPFSHLFKLSPVAAEILVDIQQNGSPTHLRRKKAFGSPSCWFGLPSRNRKANTDTRKDSREGRTAHFHSHHCEGTTQSKENEL